MKALTVVSLSVLGCVAFAGESEFIKAYDAGRYDEASRLVEGLDAAKPALARRLGVMYYDGRGVACDRERGLNLLESAMIRGDARSALNLAKIYYNIENNQPKAAWCMLVAEVSGDSAVVQDVDRLRELMGREQYLENVAACMAQLHADLCAAKSAADQKSREFDEKLAALKQQVSKETEERKQVQDELARTGKKAGETDSLLANEKENVEKISAELAAAQKQFCDLSEKYNKLESSSKEEAASWEGKIKELEHQIRKQSAEVDSADAQNNELSEKYTKLVNEYNALVELYNTMRYAYCEGSGCLPPYGVEDLSEKHQACRSVQKSEESGSDGFGRGWNTFWYAPFNFVRVVPTTANVYGSTGGVRGVLSSAVLAPFVFCGEIVPTACDFGNGLLDMLTLGAYGDWLYSGDLSSMWWKRDNTHFPWLDRAE